VGVERLRGRAGALAVPESASRLQSVARKANSGGYCLWPCSTPAAAIVAATRQPAGCEDSRSPRHDRSGRLQHLAATFMNNAG